LCEQPPQCAICDEFPNDAADDALFVDMGQLTVQLTNWTIDVLSVEITTGAAQSLTFESENGSTGNTLTADMLQLVATDGDLEFRLSDNAKLVTTP
jgi:hypothetical protein